VACDNFVAIYTDPDEGNLRAAVTVEGDKVGGATCFDKVSDFLRASSGDGNRMTRGLGKGTASFTDSTATILITSYWA
jgi:hypothetical protein